MTLTLPAVSVFAPTDGYGNPRGADMGDAQTWALSIESALSTLVTFTGASVVRDTLANLNAYSGATTGMIGLVVLDTTANKGVYQYSGSTWVRQAALPADTANANLTLINSVLAIILASQGSQATIFATKAAATAAVSTMTTTFALVLADESQNGCQVWYQKVAGALSFVTISSASLAYLATLPTTNPGTGQWYLNAGGLTLGQ